LYAREWAWQAGIAGEVPAQHTLAAHHSVAAGVEPARRTPILAGHGDGAGDIASGDLYGCIGCVLAVYMLAIDIIINIIATTGVIGVIGIIGVVVMMYGIVVNVCVDVGGAIGGC